MRTASLTAVLLLAALPALAQPTIDFTPYVGYRWGGTINDADSTLGGDLTIADSGSYGAILGFGLSPNFQIELSVARQQSELETSYGLFDPEVALGDIDVTYFQIGASWEWGRDVRPFFAGSLGAAVLDPDLPQTSSETRFAGTFSAGVKLRLSDRLGLRLDGKMLWIALDETQHDCYRCYDYGNQGMLQGEVAAGLIIYF